MSTSLSESLRNAPRVRAVGVGLSIFFFLTTIFVFTSSHESLQTARSRLGAGMDGIPLPWTEKHKYVEQGPTFTVLDASERNLTRVNATFVILARNTDVWGIVQSIRAMEDRFNKYYHYPYVFLNEMPFDDTFKLHTRAVASGECHFGQIPLEQWSAIPQWIDTKKAQAAMVKMAGDKVLYGGSLSYRQMCRYQSGFFWRHPLLDGYKYFWRIEPNVKYFCDLNYDPFKLMERKKIKYGWTVSLYEYATTIASLWNATKSYIEANPQYVATPNLLDWISFDQGNSYNLCHFWSNFEIGDLDFYRSDAYRHYFEHLDKLGGFFYERWGDAPIHSIAVALFLKPEEVHFFEDIGYRHEPFQQCPSNSPPGQCSCNPTDSFAIHYYSCTKRFQEITNYKLPISPILDWNE